MSVKTNNITVSSSIKMLGKGLKGGIAETLRLGAEGLVLATKAPQIVRGVLRTTDIMAGTAIIGEERKVSAIATEENFLRAGVLIGKQVNLGVKAAYHILTEEEIEGEAEDFK